MPAVDELFSKQTEWPRLILKAAAEGVICYNMYVHATTEKTEWSCYANNYRQPNGDGNGDNVTEAFTSVIYYGFILTLVACIVTTVEMINKKVNNKQLTILTGILDSLLGLAGVVWLIWASVVRLQRNGKICAGATTNVSEEVYPYAYNQGAFLQVMLVLLYTIPPVLLVATNCGCL